MQRMKLIKEINMQWSKKYYGLSHLGKFDLKNTWVNENSAKLLVWFPGCGFSPKEYSFDSVEEAKRKGEKIMGEKI